MTLFVCFMTVWGMNKKGNDIITKIDQVANPNNILMPERELVRPNQMSSLNNTPSISFPTTHPSFTFPDGMSPPLGIKTIQQQN